MLGSSTSVQHPESTCEPALSLTGRFVRFNSLSANVARALDYDLFDRDGRDGGRPRAGADRGLMAGAFKTARKALLTASEVGNASATSG